MPDFQRFGGCLLMRRNDQSFIAELASRNELTHALRVDEGVAGGRNGGSET